MIHYKRDERLELKVKFIVERLGLKHVDLERVKCVRSFGSKSRYTLARIHVLSRIFQNALGMDTHYVIEVISEKFDKLSKEEQTKTLIHEILHVPKSFGGGFRHHTPYVNRKIVEKYYEQYLKTFY